MGFWDKALGTPVAPPQQTVPQGPPGTRRAWWMPDSTPQPVQQGQYQQPQQAEPEDDGDPSITKALLGIGVDIRNTKAKSAKFEGGCPDCGSPNYFPLGTKTNVNTGLKAEAMRCYDCGFPIVQSASGDTMPSRGASREGSIVAAKELASVKGATFSGEVIGRV